MNYYLSLCLSVFLFFSVGGRADEAAVYDDLPSFMDIRIERLSGDARHLKGLLDQGSWATFTSRRCPCSTGSCLTRTAE